MWVDQVEYDSAMSEYWQSQVFDPATVLTPSPASSLRGSSLTLSFSRDVAAGLREDRAMVTLHFTVRPGTAGLGSTLDASDAQVVEDAFATDVWTGKMSAAICNTWFLEEYIWRNFGADYPLDDAGNSKPGPIWRARAVHSQGQSVAARLPDQLALTSTYKTASRRHWGRNYWGGFTTNLFQQNAFGHADTTDVDQLAGWLRAWFQNLWDNPRIIDTIVWSPKYRAMLSIDELTVDDVVDVVRRRRPKMASYRKTFTS